MQSHCREILDYKVSECRAEVFHSTSLIISLWQEPYNLFGEEQEASIGENFMHLLQTPWLRELTLKGTKRESETKITSFQPQTGTRRIKIGTQC